MAPTLAGSVDEYARICGRTRARAVSNGAAAAEKKAGRLTSLLGDHAMDVVGPPVGNLATSDSSVVENCAGEKAQGAGQPDVASSGRDPEADAPGRGMTPRRRPRGSRPSSKRPAA